MWNVCCEILLRTLDCSKTPNNQQIGKRRYREVKEKKFDQESNRPNEPETMSKNR